MTKKVLVGLGKVAKVAVGVGLAIFGIKELVDLMPGTVEMAEDAVEAVAENIGDVAEEVADTMEDIAEDDIAE